MQFASKKLPTVKKGLFIVLMMLFLLAGPIGEREIPPIMDKQRSTRVDVKTQEPEAITADETPWLEVFPYRKYHEISGLSGAGTGYQVEIHVRSGLGTDSGNTVYLNPGHWNPENTLRFTDDDGITLLNYWKETSDETEATYWVKINDSLENDVGIYIYYGNLSAPSLSNGDDTFVFFDDFENNNLDRWDTAGSYWTTNSSLSKHGSYSAWYDGTSTGSERLLETNLSDVSSYMAHFWQYIPDRGVNQEGAVSIEVYANGQQAESIRTIATTSNKLQYYDLPSGMVDWPNGGITLDTWFRVELGVDMAGGTRTGYNDRTLMDTVSNVDLDDNQIESTQLDVWRLYGQKVFGDLVVAPLHMDDVYIRKWAGGDPSHGLWSAEQNNLNLTTGQEWLPEFPYRKNHTIYGHPGAGTDYQVRIQVHSGDGIDSGNTVNLNNEYWEVDDPIRFTASDGITLLDYWKEYTDASNAYYWVKISENLDNDIVIYVYYGNTTTTSLSNGTATFLMFDDYENANLNRWDHVGSAWSVSSGYYARGDYGAALSGTTGGRDLYKTINVTTGCMIHSWGYLSGNPALTIKAWDEVFTEVVMMDMRSDGGLRYYQDGWTYWGGQNGVSSGTWYELSVGIDFEDSRLYGWKDEYSLGDVYLGDYNNGTVDSFTRIGLAGENSAFADDYYIRKWLTIEPIHGGWGLQESKGGVVTVYDDCSDAGEFSGIGDESWAVYTTTQVTTGSVSSTEGYIYASDYGTGSDKYGPLRYKELAYPFYVDQFVNLSAEIEVDATTTTHRGEIAISLHDETNKTVVSTIVNDRWVSQDDICAFGAWKYSNYTLRNTPNNHPEYASAEPYKQVISVYRNETGIFFNGPLIGTFELAELDQIKPHRKIKYLSVHFQGWSDGYGTDICEVLRVHSIRVSWNSTRKPRRPETTYWQDACTTSGGWVYDLDWGGWTPWATSSGTLHSESGYLYASVDADVGTGPFWYKALDTPVNLTQLHNWSVDIQSYQPEATYKGIFSIVLYDQNKQAMLWTKVSEWDGAEYDLDLFMHYRHSNGTLLTHSKENLTDADWRGSLQFTMIEGGGIIASIPGAEEHVLLDQDEVRNESQRLISYMGIQWRRGSGNYLQMRLHDIALKTILETQGPEIELVGPNNETVQKSGTLVNLTISDETSVDCILASWDGNANTSLVYPDASTPIPAGDGVHTLTIHANDTLGVGTMSVYYYTVDDTVPSVDTPSDIIYDEGDSGNAITWTLGDEHPSTYEVRRNGTIIESGEWNSTANEILIGVDGLGLGMHNYTISVYDSVSNMGSDTVLVTVVDGTSPQLDEQSDREIEVKSSGNLIVWNPSDEHPLAYECYRNGTIVESGNWNSTGETIEIEIDAEQLASYNYTLVVFDVGGNNATDTVWVAVVDTTPPAVNEPNDIQYAEGLTGNDIVWVVSDYYPDSQQILRNGTAIRTTDWDESDISISVDGLAAGTYNYTLTVLDTSGNYATDTVWVTVTDITSPTINEPTDTTYESGSSGNAISWICSDLHPSHYEVFHNGTSSGILQWDGSDIDYNIDGLALGLHNFTIILYDESENTATDTVWVTVEDTSDPVLDSPSDLSYGEGNESVFIEWSPTDLNPATYQVFSNGSPIDSGTWNASSNPIEVQVGNWTLGHYNVTIVVFDSSGNQGVDAVWVSVVDNTVPTVDSPADIEYAEGQAGNSITWSPSDLHPLSYEILLDSVRVRAGPWNSSFETISIVVDDYAIGVYNLTIVLTDVGGNTATDEVELRVYDATYPTIDPVDNIDLEEGAIGVDLVWAPFDLNPKNFTVFQNGSIIRSGQWNSSSENITVSLADLELGVYNYTLLVFDFDGNSAVEQTFVTVEDLTPPELTSPEDQVADEGTTTESVSWIASDLHPNSYEILINGSTEESGQWSFNGQNITFGLDELELGTHNITLVVLDESGNMAADTVMVTIVDRAAPLVSHPEDVEFEAGETVGNLTWTVSEVHLSHYVILVNGTEVSGEYWNGTTVSISLSGLAPGVYNYTLIVEDTSGNVMVDTVFIVVAAATTTSTTTTTGAATTTTTNTIESDYGQMMAIMGSVGAVAGVVGIGLVALFLIRRKKKAGAGWTAGYSDDGATIEERPVGSDHRIQVMRGGTLVGNRFRYKLKVLNNSDSVITDITITLVSYPRGSLEAEGSIIRTIPKIEIGGFRSPTFDFLPTQDCVKGEITASVSYVDSRGKAHSVLSKPFIVKAVCDLLEPEKITPEEFMLKLGTLGHGEMACNVDDWTPEEMHAKTKDILEESNFFKVESRIEKMGTHVQAVIKGWAKGMYTGKNIGVTITITGLPKTKGTSCKIEMSGEEEAMIMPAMDEIAQKLGAWICPRCGAALPVETVNELKAGRSVGCPFCGVTMDR